MRLGPIGTAVPRHCYDRARDLEVARLILRPTAEQESWIPGVYAKSGIEKRYYVLGEAELDDLVRRPLAGMTEKERSEWNGPSVGQRMGYYEREAKTLAVQAAGSAMEQAGCSPGQITHLVTVSCTGFEAPGVDFSLMDSLGLSADVERTHVGFMGCHGALNGLRVARGLVAAQPEARVLLCAVELCSLHYHCRWDPSRVISNSLFADGAAATVCVADGGEAGRGWKLMANGSHRVADTQAMMGWVIGDHGFEMTLTKEVPKVIEAQLGPWVDRWLAKQGMTRSEVGSWAVHPGGPRILEATENALGLAAGGLGDSRGVLRDFGNMSSPTLLFIAKRMMERGAKLPCVMLGFGPGLAIEAALWV